MGMFLRRPSRQNSVEKCPASSRLNEENSPDTSASNARHRLSPPRQILQDRAFPSGSRAAQSGCNRSGQAANALRAVTMQCQAMLTHSPTKTKVPAATGRELHLSQGGRQTSCSLAATDLVP
jgi:hypothetical protein